MVKELRYDIVISDRAKQMLELHIRFIAQVNKNTAIKLRKKIILAMRSLAIMPQRYPFVNEVELPRNKYHKMYIEKYYLVFYQIKDTVIYVDYIIDTRQDYDWLLQ